MMVYEVLIEGEVKKISVASFSEFLSLDDKEYYLRCSGNSYDNLPLPEFIYALVKYYNENQTLRDNLNDQSKKRLDELETMKVVDYEAINKYQETTDPQYGHYHLNEQLEQELDKVMERGSNKFHKFLLVYKEVANHFIYDDAYFVKREAALKKHQDINYLNQITFENNKVVCFEIIAILAHYLRKLGFNYELCEGEVYGQHTALIARFEEYLFVIEPVISVFHNDLTNLKTKRPLLGISSINENPSTKERFKILLSFYYQEEKKDYYNGILPANKFLVNSKIPVFIKEGLRLIDLALLKVKEENLEVMDAMCYLLYLIDNYKFRTDLSKLAGEIVNDINSPYGFSVLIIMSDFLAGTYYVLYNFQEAKVYNQEDMNSLFENQVLSPYDVKRKIYGIK